MKKSILYLSILLVIPIVASANGNMMEDWGHMMNFGFMPFGWFGGVLMILFWALLIVGVLALIKWLAGQGKGDDKNDSAMEALRERYAKGEISKDEFEEKKKDLK